MKKETPTQVFNYSFCENFKNSSGRLLLSVKGTINCFYILESPVNMTVQLKERPLLSKFGTIIVQLTLSGLP